MRTTDVLQTPLIQFGTGALGHDVDQEFVGHPDHPGLVVTLFGVNGKWRVAIRNELLGRTIRQLA